MSGLRACIKCCKWMNGAAEDKCACHRPSQAASQNVSAAIVELRREFPRSRLKDMPTGEKVEFVRALANLLRPYAPTACDSLDAFDGKGVP